MMAQFRLTYKDIIIQKHIGFMRVSVIISWDNTPGTLKVNNDTKWSIKRQVSKTSWRIYIKT